MDRFVFLCLLLLVFSVDAEAARVGAGTTRAITKAGSSNDEDILFIANTSLETKEGKPLYLGHKISSYKVFWLSFGIKSEGLVLGVTGERAYMPLPEGDMLQRLQEAKRLPYPLPRARLSFIQRMKGHGGFIVLIVILVLIFRAARKADE